MKQLKIHWLLILIVVLTGFLRLYRLSEIPPGVNRDEASIGYTAYSLLKTGRDEYGRFLPLSFQSFGDWKLPLYIYTTVPFVATLGLNELAVRLPSAIAGTLTVLLTYFLVKELFRNRTQITELNNQRGKKNFIGHWVLSSEFSALLSALLLAISPWHIHLSRVESESNVAVLFVTAGLLFFFRAITDQPRLLIWSAVFFALTYYTYHGNHVFTTLFVAGLVYLYRKEILKLQTWKISLTIFLMLVAIILSQTLPQADKTKLSGIGIFGDPTVVHTKIELPRNEHPSPNGLLARLTHNRVTYAITTVAQNYLKSYSPEFLFIKGGGNRAHNIEGFGNMYLLDAPFLLLGFAALLALGKQRESKLLLWWLAIAPVAASITKDAPHTNRMFAVFPALPIALAVGIQWLLANVKKLQPRRAIFLLLITLYFLSLSAYLERYYIHFPRNEAQHWGLPYKELARILSLPKNKTKQVVISHPEYSPYIYLVFYSGYDPARYQTEVVRYPPTPDAFYHVRGFGRFSFRPIDWAYDINLKTTLLIDDPVQIPETIANSGKLVGRVILPNGAVQFGIVHTDR